MVSPLPIFRVLIVDDEHPARKLLREYVTFHTLHKKITALYSLKDLEEQLPSYEFIRIHKS